MSKRNENRPEYKKTKVGWIPVEWRCCYLRDLCADSGQYGASVPAIPYLQEAPRYIRITDITDNGVLLEKNKASILYEAAEKYLLKVGDFLFARTGATVGKTYLHDKDSGHYAFAGYLIRFIPDDNLLLGVFLKNYTQTDRYYYWVKTTLHAGAQPNINAAEYGSLSVPVPPLPEQKKIAGILSTWDEAIDKTHKLIDAKKRRKKALMQQLLTSKKRLPRFNEAWKERRLGELFDERREANNEHLMLLAITGSRGVIPASGIERKDSSSADKSKYKRIAPGDIGYNTMRMWQGVSAVSDLEGIVSPAYTICIPKEIVDVRFMGYFIKFPQVINLFRRFSQGLVNDTLNLKFNNFTQIKVKIPCSDEQQAISKVLRIADDEIKTLEKKLVALEKQKRGLMQKLLTGEVRVKL